MKQITYNIIVFIIGFAIVFTILTALVSGHRKSFNENLNSPSIPEYQIELINDNYLRIERLDGTSSKILPIDSSLRNYFDEANQ